MMQKSELRLARNSYNNVSVLHEERKLELAVKDIKLSELYDQDGNGFLDMELEWYGEFSDQERDVFLEFLDESVKEAVDSFQKYVNANQESFK